MQQQTTGLYGPSQHNRGDVRSILDHTTIQTQKQNVAELDQYRKKLIDEFMQYKSKEIQTRELHQK